MDVTHLDRAARDLALGVADEIDGHVTEHGRLDALLRHRDGHACAVMRDDGAIAYLNGVEIFRNNMPAGPVNYLTGASGAVGGNDEATFFSTNVNPTLLVEGTNVLAVEIHQSGATSSDLSFDASLVGMRLVFPPTITTQPKR